MYFLLIHYLPIGGVRIISPGSIDFSTIYISIIGQPSNFLFLFDHLITQRPKLFFIMPNFGNMLCLFELKMHNCLLHLFRLNLLLMINCIQVVVLIGCIVVLHYCVCLLLLRFSHLVHEGFILYFQTGADLS